jgi:uncharacterized protein YceK
VIRSFYNFCNRNWWQINTVMLLVILALILALMAGCTETRTETASVERTRGIQAGQPTDLLTTRHERAAATTDINVELAPMVQAAVSAAMGDVKGALSGIAGQVQTLSAKPQPPAAQEIAALIRDSADAGGLDSTTGALGGAAGGLALLAMREWLAHRQTKRDEDEAWDEIKRQAEASNPSPKG